MLMTVLGFLAAVSIALTGPVAAATVQLDVQPGPSGLSPGDPFSVSLLADTQGGDGITGLSVDLVFSNRVLDFVGASFNPGFSLVPGTATVTSAGDETTVANLTAAIDPIGFDSTTGMPRAPDAPLAGDALVLATFAFLTRAPGAGTVTLSGTSGELLTFAAGGSTDRTLTTEVSVVPLPAAWLLTASGFASLALLRRRRGSAVNKPA